LADQGTQRPVIDLIVIDQFDFSLFTKGAQGPASAYVLSPISTFPIV